MSTGQAMAAPKKQNKHLNIEDAIDRLSTAKRKIKALLEEVTGDHEDKSPSTDEVTEITPLIYTLNTAGDRIADLAEDVITLTDNLREQIL